ATVACMTNWPLLVFATLGGGATGAVITTYGTQTHERRAAWTEVRARARHAAYLARQDSTSEDEIRPALTEVENAAFTAGVPWHVVAIFLSAGLADFQAAEQLRADPRNELGLRTYDSRITGHAAFRASELLLGTLWHPWLSMPTRRFSSRRIRKFLYCG